MEVRSPREDSSTLRLQRKIGFLDSVIVLRTYEAITCILNNMKGLC